MAERREVVCSCLRAGERTDPVDLVFECGADGGVVLDKMFGPWAVARFRIRLDRETNEAVFEREDEVDLDPSSEEGSLAHVWRVVHREPANFRAAYPREDEEG